MKIFMAMPFRPHFFNLFEYGYKPVCQDLGMEIETVLDDLAPGPIPQKILEKIESCDVVLVDASELNGNVYFEAGYATGIGKTVLYAVEDVAKVPFDTQQDLHLIHEGRISVIRKELPRYLASALESDRGQNVLSNPFLRVSQEGWIVRSTKRSKQRCLIQPGPEIDRSDSLVALKISRAPFEDTPVENAISVVEFTGYNHGSGSVQAVGLDGLGGEVVARCHVFVRGSEPLKHRWKVAFYGERGELVSQDVGEFNHVRTTNSWRLIEERLQIPDNPRAKQFKFSIDTTGGRGATTYWMSRPFISLVAS